MKVIFGLKAIKDLRNPVVALGVFDGVHRAHRYILKAAVKKARSIKGTSIALTFNPHPQGKESLYSLKHRIELLSDLGIDICIIIRFNSAFSRISAADFIKDVISKKIHARYVYIGKNFTFGRNAQGNYRILQKLSFLYGFKVRVFEIININNKPISSSYIRSLIVKGKLIAAQRLLLKPVGILGTVIKGGALGRQLGFPTANIDPHHEILPPSGVYAVSVFLNKQRFRGLCYIGSRPTFLNKKGILISKSKKIKNIEVYIFGFNRDIYGKDLKIEFVKKIRNERKFRTSSFLAQQIKKDVASATALFSHH